MISTDLVHWRVVGEPSSFGGSGELVHDEESGLVVALANNLDAWTSPDDSNLTAWKSVGRLYTSPLGGQDPTVWRGRNNNWFAATASKVRRCELSCCFPTRGVASFENLLFSNTFSVIIVSPADRTRLRRHVDGALLAARRKLDPCRPLV